MKNITYFLLSFLVIIIVLLGAQIEKLEGELKNTDRLVELKTESLEDCNKIVKDDYSKTLEFIEQTKVDCYKKVDENCLLVISDGSIPDFSNLKGTKLGN